MSWWALSYSNSYTVVELTRIIQLPNSLFDFWANISCRFHLLTHFISLRCLSWLLRWSSAHCWAPFRPPVASPKFRFSLFLFRSGCTVCALNVSRWMWHRSYYVPSVQCLQCTSVRLCGLVFVYGWPLQTRQWLTLHQHSSSSPDCVLLSWPVAVLTERTYG